MGIILINELKKYLTRVEDDVRKKIKEIARVTVIGAGGVGTWVTIMLSLVLEPGSEIIIIDDDDLGTENMNRLPFPQYLFVRGVKKVEAIQRYIALIRPTIKVVALPVRWGGLSDEEREMIKKSDVIIEAIDNPAAQEEIYKWASAEFKKPFVAAHYDGKSLSVQYNPKGGIATWNINWEAGYRVVPSYPNVAILVAALATEIAIDRPDKPFTIAFSLDKLSE